MRTSRTTTYGGRAKENGELVFPLESAIRGCRITGLLVMPGNAMAMHYRGIPHLVTVHYRRLPGVTVRGNDPVMGPEFVGEAPADATMPTTNCSAGPPASRQQRHGALEVRRGHYTATASKR